MPFDNKTKIEIKRWISEKGLEISPDYLLSNIEFNSIGVKNIMLRNMIERTSYLDYFSGIFMRGNIIYLGNDDWRIEIY